MPTAEMLLQTMTETRTHFTKLLNVFFLCVKDSQLNVKWHSKQTKTFLARYKPWAENEWKQQKNLKTFRKPGQLLLMTTWKCEDNLAPWKQNIRISTVLWLKKKTSYICLFLLFFFLHIWPSSGSLVQYVLSYQLKRCLISKTLQIHIVVA